MPQNASAVIVAGGRGERLGSSVPKALSPVLGEPMLLHSLRALKASEVVERTVAVLPRERFDHWRGYLLERAEIRPDELVPGGELRQESVVSGLAALRGSADWVLVHDAARPCISPALIRETLRSAQDLGTGAVPVVPASDTLAGVSGGRLGGHRDRTGIHRIQTPQAFKFDLIWDVLVGTDHRSSTDESSLLLARGLPVAAVQGSELNLKVTRQEDLEAAETVLTGRRRKARPDGQDTRVGMGYDSHRLEANRPLILGGVNIPFDKGLFGHSDGDVLVHAVIDAVLGAMAAPDIGQLFPDTDPEYKGIDSMRLLRIVAGRMKSEGYSVRNLDTVVIAEAPRLGPFRDRIKESLGAGLNLEPDRIGFKAKTAEGLGAEGEGRSISARAIVLISR